MSACPTCGTENGPAAAFCSMCKTVLRRTAPRSVPPSVAAPPPLTTPRDADPEPPSAVRTAPPAELPPAVRQMLALQEVERTLRAARERRGAPQPHEWRDQPVLFYASLPFEAVVWAASLRLRKAALVLYAVAAGLVAAALSPFGLGAQFLGGIFAVATVAVSRSYLHGAPFASPTVHVGPKLVLLPVIAASVLGLAGLQRFPVAVAFGAARAYTPGEWLAFGVIVFAFTLSAAASTARWWQARRDPIRPQP